MTRKGSKETFTLYGPTIIGSTQYAVTGMDAVVMRQCQATPHSRIDYPGSLYTAACTKPRVSVGANTGAANLASTSLCIKFKVSYLPVCKIISMWFNLQGPRIVKVTTCNNESVG